MDSDKVYYLETNALYSLVNYFDLIAEKLEAYTSFYAIEEIVSQISEDNYYKRKGILTKLQDSKLKIMPYLPSELVMAAFGKDISKIDRLLKDKFYIWERVKLIIKSDSFEKYKEEVLKLYSIDVVAEKGNEDKHDTDITERMKEEVYKETKKIMERKKKDKQICKKYGVQSLSQLPNDEKIEGVEYFEIDINKVIESEEDAFESKEGTRLERQLLISVLDSLELFYEESDIDELLVHRKKEKLVAFLLGSIAYEFTEVYNGKIPKRNDTIDIWHLIYLENENYVIVSDDKIFDNIAISTMRIKVDALKKFLNSN